MVNMSRQRCTAITSRLVENNRLWNSSSKMISSKYEIKKQVIGEGADLEKIGRILNRVIKCGRDGITNEADQRQVREIFEGLELEQANHAATPCSVDKRMEDNARIDGSKVENQCKQGQCQTNHDWDGAGDGDDKNRVQMTIDARNSMNDSQALTGGEVTKCRGLEARISYLSQDRPDLKFASMHVCCAMANPSVSDLGLVKIIGRYLMGKLRAVCLFHWQQSGELEAYSDAQLE